MDMIEWTPDLSVGIGEIDSQHREFIRLITVMPKELDAGYDAKKAAELILFLEGYADRHFKTEEMFMSVYSYPQVEAHRALHDKFRAEIALMREKAEKEEAGGVILEINRRIYGWFVEHIKVTDKKLGDFLKGKMR
jgi:hemerythrin